MQSERPPDLRGCALAVAKRVKRPGFELACLRSFELSSYNALMAHRAVHASNLPKPVGPYSPGMAFDRLVFVSGQGATDPATGRLVSDDVSAQTEQCLRNVEAILKAAGSDLQHVLRCGVFLIDMGEFQQMNAVYSRMFGSHRPARTTIQAAGLPGDGLRVEIDCVAYIP
jgi:2-iminobutanoate/2-iminopropanoate deaminase